MTSLTARSVVVADDDPVTRRLLSILLSRQGYRVHPASNGDEALALVTEVEPELLFLDAMMPAPDGYQVCARVRSHEQLRYQPFIIMVTGAGQDADRQRALDVGVNDFVTKPFSPSGLTARLRALARSLDAER